MERAMLAQSLAGLAAAAVNEGRFSELVWVESDNPSVSRWGACFLAAHPEVRDRGEVDLWSLAATLQREKIVDGYILYRADVSTEQAGRKYRPGMDLSVNVATSLAPILRGVLIGEQLEAEAKRRGLKRLLDARDKTQRWCFENYRERFRRDMLCTQDPRKPHARDYAIAQGAFTVYGPDNLVAELMRWLEPLSPILGWNGGDEFRTTRLATVHGHFQTCTDWVQNLPVLMAGASETRSPRLRAFDPTQIDWSDRRSTVSFLCSDGDNVQWFETGFFDGPGHYWNHPRRGTFPFGWTAPLTHLTQLLPETLSYAVETATPNDELVEWHSGYYYPDLFALEREQRWDLLAEQARRSWAAMRRCGSEIIGFNFRDIDSPDARKALEVVAGQTDGLLAILAFQYSPYNAGKGVVWWVKDKRGTEIPVISLRYQIWWNLNKRENAGTPMKVAREIGEGAAQAETQGKTRHDWALVHAWSYFRPAAAPGDENAENFSPKRELPPDKSYAERGGVRGFEPAVWTVDRLSDKVRVVPVSEMAWRLRMQHDPVATRNFLEVRP